MSCLFDSLSQFTNKNSIELRQIIVSYLKTNPKLLDDISFHEMMSWEDTHVDKYLNEMNQVNTWGGAIEIKAFSDLFKTNVFVHIPMIQRNVEFLHHQSSPSIHLLWTGNHFIPLPQRGVTPL
jgi:hypothetical protein